MHAYLEDAGAMVAGDALLSAALASMPYGFTIWNEDLRLAVWNDTYLAMYHLPREAIHPGMTLRDVAAVSVRTGDHGDLGIDEIAELYRTRFLHSPGAKVFEHKVRERNIRSTNTRMPGIGWVVTHQDVTEEVERNRLAAAREAALAQEAMRFEAAVNNMAQGLAMFDADRRMVICNSTFAAMYSLPPALVQPGTPLDAILEYRLREGLAPPADVDDDTVNKRVTAARQQGRSIRFIEEEQGRIISVIHQPMQDGGWVSTHQDITEQRQREELIQARTLELEVQNIRFDAAINNMLHGLSMFDAQNRLIVCNRQYAQLYGLPAELTKPGTSFWQMLEHGEKTGMVSIADGATRRKVLGAVIEAGQPVKQNVTMVNGRVIAILHQPMVGGGWISTHEDVTEQHKSEEMIRHLARHDALTNLPNRVLFREEMAMLDNRIRRGERMAVLCVDLDRFKAVNDSLGHAAGDRALKVAAQRLREAARDKDIVARLGGDEFAVLAGPFENPRHAGLIAQRIVKAMEQPINLDGNVVVVGASVGIAVAPVDGEDAETLLRNADLALYRAKNDGRSGYHFFERGMDEALKHRRSLELGLKRALGADEFRLVFQPEIGLGDGRISSLEALLRWDHPDRGMIEPGEFIPIAEETGMMVSIGAWVVREACRTAAAWPEPVRVAVNLSAGQFRSRGLLDDVAEALAGSGLKPGRLELEVTESLLLANPDATLDLLHRLKRLGVRIVMDDFGTGYSSLSYLRRFPFDKIKIDRSFMTDLAGDSEAGAVVAAMIGLGKSLGMATTAEGVETEAQLDAVRERGCEAAQGYLFSPPLPASGVEALLRTRLPSPVTLGAIAG